jgi:hypothetical protein
LPLIDGQSAVVLEEIHLRNLQIHGRLLKRLIFDLENPPCSRLVPCFETFLSAGRVILDEKIPLFRWKSRYRVFIGILTV